MGRFAPSKAISDNPSIIKRALNYLIDLLDQGYSTQTTIGGKKIVINITPKVGIEITVNDAKVFGIDTNGNLFASRIANSENPEIYYAKLGDVGTANGISFYNTNQQAEPTLSIVNTYTAGVLAGNAIIDSNGVTRIGIDNSGNITIYDHNYKTRLWITLTGNLYVYDESGETRFYSLTDGSFHVRNSGNTKSVIEHNATSGYTIIRNSGVADNGLMVTDVGVYKIVAGVQTAL